MMRTSKIILEVFLLRNFILNLADFCKFKIFYKVIKFYNFTNFYEVTNY